jgi:hypothetical protein
MAAIDQKINLIGVPEVEQGLDKIIAKTKQTVAAVGSVNTGTVTADIGAAAQAATSPIEIFNVTVKNSAAAMHEAEGSGHALAEALHVLHPILGEVGGGMGELGAFARLASAGIGLFSTAIAGTLIVKLTLLSDELAKTKGKLGDLLGSQGAGATAFELISKDAEKLGTNVDALLPGFEKLIRAGKDLSSIHFFAAPGQELPEAVSGTKQAADAITGLFTVLRAGHADLDEAGKTTDAFASALQNAGALTKQVASVLLPFPKAFDALKIALGASGQSTKQFLDNLDKAPISFQRVSTALQQLTNQIPAGFDPKAPQGLKDAIEELWNAVKEGAKIDQPKALEQMVADLAPKVKELAHDFTLLVPPAIDAFIDFGRLVGEMFAGIQKDITGIATQYDLLKTLLTTTDLKTFTDALKQLLSPNPQPLKDTAQNLADVKTKIDQVAESAKKLPGQIFAPSPGQTAAPPGSAFAPTSEGAPAGFVTPPKVDAKSLFNQADVTDAVKSLGDTMDQAFAEFKFSSLTDSVDQSISEGGTTGAQNVQQSMSEITFTQMGENFNNAMNTIVQNAQSAWDRITAIFSQQLPSPSGGGFGFSGTPLAGGGLVSGPGTGTSDSILARVSAGEFIMTAAATRLWGAQFLASLNNMTMPALIGPPRYARFAGGGAVQIAGRSVHLHIGNQSFQLHGAADIVNRLEREASIRNLASTGIAQTWVGGRR